MAWFWTIFQLLIRLSASFRSCGINVTWNLIQIGGLNHEISYSNLPQVISRVFQVIKNSLKGGFIAWCWTIIQLIIHFTVSFSSCNIKMLHGILYKIGGLNQEISYSNLPHDISRVFQVIWNSFEGGFMAWFWTNIQLLIRLSASFSSCDIKMLHGIWYKIGGLNHKISYSNLPQVISRVFQVK